MKNQHRSRRKTQWIQGKSRPMKKKGRCAAQKMGKCYKKTILKWYEFMQYCGHPPRGGCGLKLNAMTPYLVSKWSSPTRGMWIEMARQGYGAAWGSCHPPRGGCGLKYPGGCVHRPKLVSSPTRGMWIEMCPEIGRTMVPWSHPPRGGCGLKSGLCSGGRLREPVIPHAGDVD